MIKKSRRERSPRSTMCRLRYWMRGESAVGNKPAADVRLLQPIKCNLWKDPRFCAITHVAVCNYPCTRSSFRLSRFLFPPARETFLHLLC